MKTILITGSTSGIGKACAELFAKDKHQLILCGRNTERLNNLASELAKKTTVTTLQFDVSEEAEVKKSIQSLPENFKNIDVLINNAGNAHGLSQLSEGIFEDWDAMMDGNVKGLLYVSKEVIPGMKSRQQGHIINLSSVAGLQTYSNGVVYCASKKAVEAISEGMRLELTEFGIKISNIRPGAVATDFSMVRFKGDAEKASKVYEGYQALLAEDVANTIAYCVNAPAHVTIANIDIFPSAQSSATSIYRK